MRHAVIDTTLGRLTAVADGNALVGLYFPGHWTNPDRYAWGRLTPMDPVFEQCRSELEEYARGERRDFTVAYDLRGNEFQRRVWAELESIDYGSTTTYGALAERVGVRNAQLVGQAVGHNPISVVVPCHRVIGADGGLTGYAGGVDRKVWLLEREGALPASLFDDNPVFDQA